MLWIEFIGITGKPEIIGTSYPNHMFYGTDFYGGAVYFSNILESFEGAPKFSHKVKPLIGSLLTADSILSVE